MPESVAQQARDRASVRHVAVIMDGNGRWARARGLPRVAGHREGAKVVREVVTAAAEGGVGYLTLFAFSTENWRRPVEEVRELMGLLRLYLRRELAELHANNIRVAAIGERHRLPEGVRSLVEEAETLTADNTGLQLTLALSYGGRQEITEAVRSLARDAAAGRLDPGTIDEAALGARLFTADMPDPDVVIRTSGEQRISNFLLWQIAYAEFVFIDKCWPDLTRADFEEALGEFGRRERRFGAVV